MALTVAELRALFTADTRDIDRAQDHIRKDTSKTQGVLKTATGTMAGFLGANLVQSGGRALFGFLKSTADGASDLNETLSMSTVIFGKNEKAQERWASTAWKSAGLSKQAALETAAGFGDMFAQLGFGEKQAARMSRATVQLAADLGSFKNLPTAEVTDMISGALRGEYDALQRVIPNISAARVETKALAMTHKDAAKDLTAAEKAAATLAIVHHDGARAAGDFARTSSGAANQQKILSAQIANTKTKIGTALLPAYREFFQWTNDKVVPAVDDFIDGMKEGTGAGGEFVDVLHDVKDIGEGVFRFFDSIPGPVKKYGVELLIAWAAMNKITNATGGLRNGLTSIVQGLADSDARLDTVAKTSYALGAAVRQLAGAGGLLMLTKSMSEADDSSRTLERTLGGALAGFSIGGPIGAAVGTLAGFTSAVVSSGKQSAKAFNGAEAAAGDYGATLDNLTAKLTKNTQATVVNTLQKNNDAALRAANALGVSNDTLARSLMGKDKAQRKVNQAIRDGVLSGKMMTYENGGQARASDVLTQALFGMATETENGVKKTKGLVETFREARREARENAKRARELSGALKGIPTKVVSEIIDKGGPQSLTDIEALIDRYKRTPKQVRTLIRTLGFDVTDRELRTLIDHGKTLDQMDPTLNVDADTRKAKSAVSELKTLIDSLHDRNININVTKSTNANLAEADANNGRRRGGGSNGRIVGGGRGSSAAFRGTIMSGYAGLTGTPLEILEEQRTVRDTLHELRQRNKKGQHVVRGLDRRILLAQLEEARKELARLMSKAVDQDAIDAYKAAAEATAATAAGISAQLKSSQSIFSSGTTSAATLLKNMRTNEVTNDQWATLLAKLSTAGLSKQLLDEFIAEGPSAQTLKLGNSILSTGNIADLNAASTTLDQQRTALGAAGASGNLSGLGGPLFTIAEFNTYGMTPDEVAKRLYFTAQVQS